MVAEHSVLAASLALNLYLWWRLRAVRSEIPQEAIDHIHALSAQLELLTARLKAAEETNQSETVVRQRTP